MPSSWQSGRLMEFNPAATELFYCRHCDKDIRTSEVRLRKALLCEECNDSRDAYRKANPRENSVKTESNWMGDQYGWNKLFHSYVCGSCGIIYHSVPEDYIDRSAEEQEAQYEYAVNYRKQRGYKPSPYTQPLLPFHLVLLNYEIAPKGWANQEMCKTCFDSLGIQAIIDKDTVARIALIESDKQRVKEEAIKKWKRESDSNFVFKWQVIIMVGMLLFLLFALGDCSGHNTGDLNPRHF
jgi:hypothetical protein